MNRVIAVLSLCILAFCSSAFGQAKPQPPAKPAEKIPVSYGLVADNSGSFRMLLDNVVRVVSDVVEANGVEDEAFLVTFVDTEKIVLRQEFTSQKSELHDAAQNMFIEGGQTAILDAVKSSADYLAANARSDPGRARALVLVTDGEDRESKTKIEDVLKVLKENNIRVMVIAMSSEKIFTKILDRLVKETGGLMLTPKTRADLTAAAKEVSAAMRAR